METTRLGTTGRRVSRLGFGGAPAGLRNYLQSFDPGDPSDTDSILAAIRRACELGITYFDTAAGYGAGAGERLFGEALAGVERESVFLATKAGIGDRTSVRRSLETSLTHLRRDSVDLLQAHGGSYSDADVDAILNDGGMLDEMERMRDEGLLRFVGFTSENQNAPLYRLIECGRFDVMQVCYNIIFQHPYDPSRKCGCLYDAEARGLGIVTMRSATSGIFQRWVQTVNPANTFDYTPTLLQFQLSNPLVDVALVGMRSAAEVEMNVRACEDEAARMDLDALHERYV